MDRSGFSGDEVWGVFAIGALRSGDIEGAAKMLSRTRFGYAAGFLVRLVLVAPGLALRMTKRLVGSRWKRRGTIGGHSA